jgi:hypothetical protein
MIRNIKVVTTAVILATAAASAAAGAQNYVEIKPPACDFQSAPKSRCAVRASAKQTKTARHRAAQSLRSTPSDAYGSVSSDAPAVTVYAPDMKMRAHLNSRLTPDFQLGGEK